MSPSGDKSGQPPSRRPRRIFSAIGNPSLTSSAGDQLPPDAAADELPSSAASSPAAIQFLNEGLTEYEIIDRIDQGGQGAVYKARQRGTGRMVALKLLLDGPLASERRRFRFEREIELSARLRHANIVTLFESGVVHGRLYYTMELIDGLPIDDYAVLHDLAPRELVTLLLKVCRAVQHAHLNGIIHRDLKPANIIVEEAGEPHVFDFGLAKEVASQDGGEFSCTGQVIGTLPYLSPEQAGGLDGRTDVRTDVYTLGVILYQLLTDGFPYAVSGVEASVVRRNIVSAEAVPLRKAIAAKDRGLFAHPEQLTRDLEAIVAKALAKRKDERYASAGDLADDLQRYLNGAAVRARGEGLAYLAFKTIRKHRVAATMASVVLISLVGVAGTLAVSWMRVRAERDRAFGFLFQTESLLDLLLSEFEEPVRRLAGGVEIRDQLVARLEERLPELQRLAESDEAFVPISIRLLEKQGDIALIKHDRHTAHKCYASVLASRAKLAARNPADAGLRDGLVVAYRNLAEVLDDPSSVYAKGIEIAEAALAAAPDASAARKNLCEIRIRCAAWLRQNGRAEQALTHLDRAASLLAGAAASQRELTWRRLRAETLAARGRTLLMLGRGAMGIPDLKEGLELRIQTALDFPADVEARYELLRDYNLAAPALRDSGDIEGALRALQSAIEEGEKLARLDPTATRWNIDRFVSFYEMGSLCLQTAGQATARPFIEKAVSLSEALTASEPASADMASRRVYSLILMGRLQLCENDRVNAWSSFEAALLVQQAWTVASPRNPATVRQLAVVWFWLGCAARELAEFDAALTCFERTYELRAELFSELPEDTELGLTALEAHVQLAGAYFQGATATPQLRVAAMLESASRDLEALCEQGRLHGYESRSQRLLARIHDINAQLRSSPRPLAD